MSTRCRFCDRLFKCKDEDKIGGLAICKKCQRDYIASFEKQMKAHEIATLERMLVREVPPARLKLLGKQ